MASSPPMNKPKVYLARIGEFTENRSEGRPEEQRGMQKPQDRITPYKQGGSIKERVNEVFVLNPPQGVHFEMISNSAAWLRIGTEVFWLNAKNHKLVCCHGETQQEYAKPATRASAPMGLRHT